MADQDGSDASPPASQASYYQSEDGRASSATPPGSSASGQIYSPTLTSTPTPTRTAASTSPNNQNTAVKADSLLFNKTDERLRLARERREEREKQNAIKEAEWQAREERARQHYEKHLEERRRKLEEQRIKEEQRRAAVEEKRRQKQEDDKVRHEAVMRRTMERSQVTRPKTNRWSWGGTLPPNSPGTPTGFAESAFLYPLDLAGLEHVHGAFSLSRRYRMMSQYADRRSVSTVNLSKHHDPVITKRLSSSSATLLHSPDRGLQTRATSLPAINKAQSKPRLYRGTATLHKNTGHRRLPLTPWESNVVNRLQQPTHSYLARSRSAMSLTGEQTAMPVCPRSVSCHPMGSMSFKALQARPLSHSRSHERSLSRETTSSAPARRRTMGTTQSPQKSRDSVRKSWSNLSVPLGPALTLPLKMRTSSPTKRNVKVTAPSPGRPPLKPTGRPPTPKMLKSPGAEDPGNFRPARMTMPDVQRPSTPTKTQETEDEQVLSPPQPLGLNKSSTEQTSTSTSENISSPPTQKTSAGTTDPEEASRIMAENRRLAREQREREEEERRQQEEQARLAKEEMARRKAEERARREEEAHRQAEEKRMKEEEERKMEEERLQKEREEADRAQKQREEEESRQKEQAERLRQERVKHFQKEEAERLERKKRLEEIMKRTRRSDTTEKKPPSKNRDSTVGAASPVPSEGTPSPTPHSNGNRSPPDPNMNASTSTPPLQRENGELEEVIELPSHSRLTPPPNKGDEEEEGQQQQGEVITFRENGLPKPLSGVDDISVQQGADVA
ncbi:ensconsin isoform X5 [Dunckerocampus dactyliophorus]|uniref:ensconsin isoform X5 n=1 Tax=Dunckerocampus dactyliophorus TaxID=161453 RepID=UPI0024059F55|nr:ensconsin isoform X5 [Dunckerocampus dactyliophorus]